MLIAPKDRLIVTASVKSRIMETLPSPGIVPTMDRFIQGYEGSAVFVNRFGIESLTSAKRIPSADWFAAVDLPTGEAFEPIRAMQRRMLLATFFLTLLAGAMTWWMLRRQFSPLIATAEALTALSSANQIPPPLPVTSQDEIGQLTRSFNRLIETWTQREDALRKSEQDLAITLNSIGDAVITTDPSSRITGMNPTAERLCGWSLADAMGQGLAEVFHIIDAGTREPVADPVQMVLAHGQVVGLANHTLLLAKDGQEYQIADSAAPIRNASGEIVGVVLVFSDVTAKYRIGEALRESEEQFRILAALAPVGIYLTDAKGDCLYANTRWCAMAGMDMQAALGRGWVQGLHPDDRAAVLANWKQMVDSEGTWGMEYRFQTPDKQVTWVYALATPYRDEAGKIVKYVGINLDITKRKQAETKLQLAANVFTHAREGIIITDVKGTIIDVNEAFTRITGYGREEALEQNPRILKSGRQDKAFYEVIWRDLTEQGHWSGEIWNRRKDGEAYAELLTISSVRDASGAVQQYVGLFSDISAMMQHQSQLEHIAHFDDLTNLPNRVLLADRLQQAMAQAQRRENHLAVVFLDLDGFKAINDQHGHDAGDQVLVKLAERMKQALREGDSLARLGGDEFVAVLIDLEDQAACLLMLSRLLLACAQSVQVGDLSLHVSASLGVTFYPQAQDIDADQLIRQADQAMYQAKLAGKNRYHIFDTTQDSSIRGHHESVERIRLALEMSEFVLYYQPKVNMRSGQIIGAEALIRWQHPEKGLLLPAVFLPVIEDHPLAVSIGEWVIDTALTQMEIWQAAGLDFGVSVNIGARQLQQSDFVDRLKFILAKHPQVNPASLELEVLETSALEDIAQVSQVIEDCAQIGVTCALDDFGTGYSSLTYLKRLRVAMLKIDQSFVRDMLEDPDDLAILQGIIGLAASFKRHVIAEGVETIEHGSLLMQLGCELAQGYGIARPMPAQQMPAWAAQWQPDAAWHSLWSSVPPASAASSIDTSRAGAACHGVDHGQVGNSVAMQQGAEVDHVNGGAERHEQPFGQAPVNHFLHADPDHQGRPQHRDQD